MTIISVVGAGVMGTAITFPAADNGHAVRLVGTHLDEEIIRSCKTSGLHPKLRRPIPPSVQPFFYAEIGEALQGAEVIVLGVNSRGVRWAAEAIAPYLQPEQIILMVTKGLESTPDGKLMILPDVLAARLPEPIRDQVHYAAVGGPSIAGELAARRHTSVVFVSRKAEILPRLQAIFSTPYYHIWTSTDMIGVEVCVALKNAYALATGLAQGVLERLPEDIAGAKNHNYAAAIFAQGLAETAYLVQLLGGNLETVFSLPGAGDLYVTTQGGRNSRMGRLLGMGMAYSQAVEEMPNETIEGVDCVLAVMPAIESLIAQGKIAADALPLLRELHRILTRNAEVAFDFNSFFSKLSFAPPLRQRAQSD
ncbi:MAG: glycerol-3-phosphate dehydrogenase [Candidatus Thermofonsia Clade 1 bacterium]|uniref:Glycerol-3-phosphate dehydrogenase n=1 Tax=Candidatus Thermofonsia Clade 1 bacterium TaxID=2364210 RepID=A0A2M8PCM1_9CHLR|nr:MAG: glycerol-3-phosphate dehydrogenase [Candidatus Thermofonsia Clade 1 bacterium]RMF52779.1 MAG: glycerol-3-phosphate dehydrogenase [Chloroflexota bacterium]